MAMDINTRLSRLKDRRSDPSLAMKVAPFDEAYHKRSSDTAIRYALGAMQEVDPRSTQISHEEAERVQDSLKSGLGNKSLYPEFKLQGSVPANVHIKGVSDVDLLCIEGVYLQYETCQPSHCSYGPYTGSGSLVTDVLHLRKEANDVLASRFWAANVDNSGDKSIELTGGAFRRKVDVVPASWFDTKEYQQSLDGTVRAVRIVNKRTREQIENFPFLYIQKLNEVDHRTFGGAKMAIRLLKNLKSDSDEDIDLSSYDIGSLVFACPVEYLSFADGAELSILAGIDRWLGELAAGPIAARNLDTPDETRKIIDSEAKMRGLVLLSGQTSLLAREVGAELGVRLPLLEGNQTLRDHLRLKRIPYVA